jgi:hypothetical protein
MEQDKLALRASSAGMRFIAQMHIYNQHGEDRLRQFITESYHANLLAEKAVAERLAEFQALFRQVGKMKVKQVVAVNKENAIVIMENESNDTFYYVELKVEEEYPHQIVHYLCAPMREVTEE